MRNTTHKLFHDKTLRHLHDDCNICGIVRNHFIVFSKVTTSLEEGHAGYEIDLTTHIQLFASAAKVMVTDRQHQFYSINTGETWFSLDLQEYDRQTATRIQSDTCIN